MCTLNACTIALTLHFRYYMLYIMQMPNALNSNYSAREQHRPIYGITTSGASQFLSTNGILKL